MKIFIILIIACFTLIYDKASAGEIFLSAGVGLKDVLNDMADTFTKKNQSIVIKKNYAAAGVLAKQLDSGACTDIVIVANVQWMNYMKEKKYADANSVTPFAYNTLVFVTKNNDNVKTLNDLAMLDRIAIGSPKSVPAGEYAMEAFKNAGIEKKLEKKLVMTRDVRDCLMYAERREVDGAFVYRTDALLSRDTVIRFAVPQALHSRIVYLSALTVSGLKNKDAVSFFSFIHSDQAKPYLLKYGFKVN